MEPIFSWKYDEQYDLLEIFVDGKLAGEWGAIVDPEDQVKEFERVFNLGRQYEKMIILKRLEEINEKYKQEIKK